MSGRAPVVVVATVALLAGCLGLLGPEPPETPATEAWPEGQALFERDADWKGGDGAQTLPLGQERVLWLFGDSLVQPLDGGSTTMVHNTVAIQQGSDPANASFEAFWRTETVEEDQEGLPDPIQEDGSRERATAFFPNESSEVWYWPGGPARVGDDLVVFANRVRKAGEGAFGFEAAGWRVFEVSGVDREPTEWRIERVDPAIEDHNYTVGVGALVHEGHLYGYGQRSTESEGLTVHEVAVVRWSLADVRDGRWDAGEWWTGEAWSADGGEEPAVLFSTMAASFSVHLVDDRVVVTTHEGFPTGDIALRAGPAPEGPFSEPAVLHEPPADPSEEHFQYAARLHPELGDELVFTWHDSRYDRPRMGHAVSR